MAWASRFVGRVALGAVAGLLAELVERALSQHERINLLRGIRKKNRRCSICEAANGEGCRRGGLLVLLWDKSAKLDAESRAYLTNHLRNYQELVFMVLIPRYFWKVRVSE